MIQKIFLINALLLTCVLLFSLTGSAQKQIIITSSRENNYCNGTCTLIDNADLNSNPTAVLFIKPVEVNGINLNPHPVCSYYNGKQWSVMNTDNTTMSPGSRFSIEYYDKPDETHFVHVISKENQVKARSYIDHAGLNGNPNARFEYIQSASPNVRGGGINKAEVKFQYDEAAGKWFVSNSNGTAIDNASGYCIMIISELVVTPTSSTAAPASTFVPGPKPDPTIQRVFMTVTGKLQGQFTGENNTNRIELTGFDMEVAAPRDLNTGLATGRRQRLPVTVQKATGPASIQFYKALTTNEQLTTVTIEVYKNDSAGNNILAYRIVLTNASISDFRQSFTDDRNGFTDSIKIVSQSILLTYGTLTTSDTL